MNERGQFAVIGAVAFPVLALVLGAAIDSARWSGQRAQLQTIADAAALAGAYEMRLANANQSQIEAAAEAVASAMFSELGLAGATADATADMTLQQVGIVLSAPKTGSLTASYIGADKTMQAEASALAVGENNICVIALEESGNGVIDLSHDANILASDCAVYSNSTHNTGIKAKNSATLTAAFICSAGGVQQSGANFTPSPILDCPPVIDPLSARPTILPGVCDHNDFEVNEDETVTLYPGVYCGGVKIEEGAVVTFDGSTDDGIFVIKDGPLRAEGAASLAGDGVGFYFHGSGAELDLRDSVSVDFTAPETGDLAGLIFYEHRNNTSGGDFRIMTDGVVELEGTIYLPLGELFVGADTPLSQNAAFTILVVNRFSAEAGPTIALNTDYAASTVPVPAGVGPVSKGDIRLMN